LNFIEIAIMNRPTLFLGLVLIGSWVAGQAAAGAPALRPNVVIILADDMGYIS
jgi:hypothetical protein